MRVGLLGLGRIGAFHAATLAAHPLVDELIVADPVRTSPYGKQGDPFDADVVVIATPTATHADLILRAARQGVPAFCEKPVAPTLSETVKVLDACAEHRVQIGFQRRFDPGYVAAAQALRSGELGELHRVHMVTADPVPPRADYIPQSGGIFRDCHIHDFDALRWVTGREVRSVYATGANRGAAIFAQAGDVDNSAALLTLDDGTLATLQGSRYNGGGYDVRMELAGTRRTHAVGLGPRAPLHSTEGLPGPRRPWPDFLTRFETAYWAEIDCFLRGETNPCSIEDALEALYIAEAADLSLRARRPVEIHEVR
ncbi:myo-inositol 2-dehydrogenase / D-chiro-inositol 1-dehydrogenase [Nonomuraea maritima]|uniref:Myo-inositol 2-dehydrogenase / D-chiro-inositol 1-dehydrogenase n=1 Tax=Nonomuraea maritima TaxID=683260 RepID=A0A1G8ULS7_9ACTN|nr:Gfo/Idh/MocA family oxidoreductase [Nonomuraea maritima]SDJ54731.1 myo-inositol 2-dehydrogenase / D-chiro-inositol 1-dehydrogenase [Nonomuraea maritima]